MTLGQYATAVGAPPRRVQNARGVLRLRGRYDERGACELGLALTIADATGMPIVRAWPAARSALAAWPDAREWACGAEDGSVRVVIDLERYQSAFTARLSLARESYAERRRGRPRARARNPIAAARAYGIDLTLIDESMELSPAQRLRRMDEMSEFFRMVRLTSR